MFKEGNKFEYPFIVDQSTYFGFKSTFNDNNVLHTNQEFAESKGFKGIVMHGNILNGFLSYFVGECLPIKNVIIHSQEIQFKNPVYLNNRLMLNAEIVNFSEAVGVVEFKFKFMNDSGKIVAKGKIQIGII